jgi:hypothetical protein
VTSRSHSLQTLSCTSKQCSDVPMHSNHLRLQHLWELMGGTDVAKLMLFLEEYPSVDLEYHHAVYGSFPYIKVCM